MSSIMTQKEKLIKAFLFAQRVKAVARALKNEARNYDVRFPASYADELTRMADDYLGLK